MATKGIVNPPNETTKHGNLEHSSGGLSSQPPWDKAPNNVSKGPHVNSCGPTGRGGSPVGSTPNARAKFNVADARAGYDRRPAEPIQGGVLKGVPKS